MLENGMVTGIHYFFQSIHRLRPRKITKIQWKYRCGDQDLNYPRVDFGWHSVHQRRISAAPQPVAYGLEVQESENSKMS
jgi:hypothetical protein